MPPKNEETAIFPFLAGVCAIYVDIHLDSNMARLEMRLCVFVCQISHMARLDMYVYTIYVNICRFTYGAPRYAFVCVYVSNVTFSSPRYVCVQRKCQYM